MTSLNEWRAHLLDARLWTDDPLAAAWADARVRFAIPWRYAEQLIDGVAQDLTKTRYQTFAVAIVARRAPARLCPAPGRAGRLAL